MISLSHITLRRGAKVVLDDVSLTLNPGEKVGLVGRNGAGKSSLFALLAGDLHEDAGDFQIPAGWQMAQVALRRGAKVLLDGASITIHLGEKVGLVGRNGAGKSTLFALLNGSLHEDGGGRGEGRADQG